MVVSEIAKRHSRGMGRSPKKAAALLAAVMLLGSGMTIEAAPPTTPTLEELVQAGIFPGATLYPTSIAIGRQSSAGAGQRAVAIGYKATITDGARLAFGGMAVGAETFVGATQGVALGYQASVDGKASYSVALGSGSVANEESTISVGNGDKDLRRRVVNLDDGVNDYDAVNMKQLKQVKAGILSWDADGEGNPTKKLNGVDLAGGSVTVDGHDSRGFQVTGQNGRVVSYLHAGDLKINDSNSWNSAGLKAGHVQLDAKDSTAITVTTGGTHVFAVDDDGALRAADGRFSVTGAGIAKAHNFTLIEDGKEIGNLYDVNRRTSLIESPDDYTTIIGGQVAVESEHEGTLGGLHIKGTEKRTVTKFLSDGSAVIGQIQVDVKGAVTGLAVSEDVTAAATVGQIQSLRNDITGDGVYTSHHFIANGDTLTQAVSKLDEKTKANEDGIRANQKAIESWNDAGIHGGTAKGDASLAIGQNSEAGYSTKIPLAGTVGNTGNLAIGNGATSNASPLGIFFNDGTAIGTKSMVLADKGTAVGANAQAAGLSGVAIGEGAKALGIQGTAVGQSSEASVAGSTAIGQGSSAVGMDGTALGKSAKVETNALNAVAIGAGSVAEESDTVSVGSKGKERRIVHVADGGVYVGSTDAVNGGQLNLRDQYMGYDKQLSAGNAADLTTGVNNAYALAASAGKEAARHTTVSARSNNLIVNPLKNEDGSWNYDVSLNPHISVESITAQSAVIGGVAFDGEGVAAGTDFVTNYKEKKVSLNDVYDRTSLIKRTDDYTTIIGDQVAVQAGHDDTLGGLYLKGKGGSTVTKFLSDGSARIGALQISKTGVISGVADGVKDSDAVNLGQLRKKADAADLDGVVYWDDREEQNHTIQGVKLENGEAIGKDFKTSYKGGVVSLNDVYERTMHIERHEESGATVIENRVAITAGNEDGTGGIYIRGTNDRLAASILEDGSFMAANGKLKIDGNGNLRLKAGKSEWLATEDGAGMRYGNSMVAVTKGKAGIRAKNHEMMIDKDGITFTNTKEGTKTNISGNAVYTGTLTATEAIYAGKIAINDKGRITGLAEGIEDTDAVTMSQLKAVGADARKHSTVSVNDRNEEGNLVLKESQNADGSKNYDVSLSDQLFFSSDPAKAGIHFMKDGDPEVSLTGLGLFVGNTSVQEGRIGGLSNTTFDFEKYANGTYSKSGSGVAATQGQLADVFGFLNEKIDKIEINGDGNVTVDKKPGEGSSAGSSGSGTTEIPTPGAPSFDIGLSKDKIDLGKVTIEGNAGKIHVDGTVSAGKTSISDSGIKVGEGEKVSFLTENSLTVGGKEYIGEKGLNANGERVTNVADGKEKGDAVNYGQLEALEDTVKGNSSAIGDLGRSVHTLGGEIDSVGAISAALAGLHPIDYDPNGSKYQLAAAMGTYDGTQALALGGFYHVNPDILLSAGLSTAFGGQRKTAGNVGLTIRVGSGKSSSMGGADSLKEANRQLVSLKEDNEALHEKVEDLEAKLSMLMESLKK